jgi:CDP-glycerol glycerophosphotransferase
MPRLSFVLVLHGGQAFVQETAASLLGPGDLELVVVDDASEDHTPELLDELAASDERVRVHHAPARLGLAAARDLGLELARGDYVWFVEIGDLLPAGALSAVMRTLAADEPDVLLVPHDSADPLGKRREGPRRRALARMAEQGPGPLERHTVAARLASSGWNTILRRELLTGLGVHFGAGAHGELAVTWPALLSAERIAALPATGYLRRRPGSAVAARGATGGHDDVFAAYDAVFAFADARDGLPAARRRLLVGAMLDHQLALLRRVPAAKRPAFFTRIGEARRAHRRGDEPAPKGRAARARLGTVERGSYRGYRALESALARRKALSGRKATVARTRRKVHNRRLLRYYAARRRQPIDENLAVFAAYWFRNASCNPRAIYDAARELVPGLRAVWVVKPDGVDSLPAGAEHVLPNTREYYDLIARAKYFVNNVNYPNHLVKRPGTVHVMTHHGTPLKRMGLDQIGMGVGGGLMDFPALLRRCERWDFSVSANPFSSIVWERVYPTRYESLETGYPRNDVLVRSTEDDVQRIRAGLGIEPGQTAVLYAPTHREWQTGFVPVLDLAEVAARLGPDHVLLARLHYFYGADQQLEALHREGRIRDVASYPSVEELCLAADLLMTDYSSIMFDYAVLDRPIVIHAPDWEQYRTTRGTYFDLMEEPPGVITRNEDDVVEAIRSGAAAGPEAAQARAAFRARFCSLEDGRASERVVRRVFLGDRAALDRSPAPVAR